MGTLTCLVTLFFFAPLPPPLLQPYKDYGEYYKPKYDEKDYGEYYKPKYDGYKPKYEDYKVN
jgi:hypothetical protein